jgi:hypothetical protein
VGAGDLHHPRGRQRLRRALDGSRPRRLARGQPYPSRIAALPDRVLWMNENNRLDAQILMLRR